MGDAVGCRLTGDVLPPGCPAHGVQKLRKRRGLWGLCVAANWTLPSACTYGHGLRKMKGWSFGSRACQLATVGQETRRQR